MSDHPSLSISFHPPLSARDSFPAIHMKAIAYMRSLLADIKRELPPKSLEVTHLCTHLRPHLDEYMAMLLFEGCLPEEHADLPMEETIMHHATDDSEIRKKWSTAAVFGLGGVQNGGAEPLLIFDEHVTEGKEHTASSAVSLVARTLFGRTLLPKGLFQMLRETDIIDAFGGAHPKHLANYIMRMHDYAATGLAPFLDVRAKQAIVEACLVAIMAAYADGLSFWKEPVWKDKALASFASHVRTSSLRQFPGFDQAQAHLLNNLQNFRQPHFPTTGQNCKLTLAQGTSYRIYQTIMIPYLAALLPEVWGGETGNFCMGILWDSRLITQIHYTQIFRSLEEHFGAEPEDGEVSDDIGHISFRKVPTKSGNAGQMPWVFEITPKPGMCNGRQALTSFVRKHNNDRAITLLRNTQTKTLVVSRGSGIPKEQWDALVDWLIEWEGSSDTEGKPGCWHIVKNANGDRADFLLNGNAAHRYVPESRLDIEKLADWVHKNC
ncbi:MAG: hypothetical protein K5657_07345 [Desulfovibrio sp.]|nr:hypothetical protein [Desulfovibrio sp.]